MIVSVITMKGGTGKTTTAIALATALSRAKKSVTVLDADPQSTASVWAMSARDEGEPLPFDVRGANFVEIQETAKSAKGNPGEWYVIDCPPNGQIMDEAAKAADMVIIPTTTGPADVSKAIETARTLAANGTYYAVLVTMTKANTLSLKQTLGYLDDADESYFETQIPAREAIKNSFGHAFANDLFGYEKVCDEIREGLEEDDS